MHSFAGREFVNRHEYHDGPGVTLHVFDGNYVEASNAAKRFAAEQGLIFEGGFFNYARREGLKTAYLEAYDAIPDGPDVVVQAVASGMGLYGGHRGMREYQRLGRLHKTPSFRLYPTRYVRPNGLRLQCMARTSFGSGTSSRTPTALLLRY